MMLCPPIAVNLENIVQHRHKSPLSGDFGIAAQGETPEAKGFSDIAKNGFDGTESFAVNVATFIGIDFLSHPFQGASFVYSESLQQEIHLPRSFLLC